MPPRSRHRKAQLTVLPPGVRVQTGKGRTAAKQAQFGQPLPLSLISSSGKGQSGSGVRSNATRSKPLSWPAYLGSFFAWRRSGKAKESHVRRPEVAYGQYDPISKSVFIEIAGGTNGHGPSDSMRLLWQCGFFGKGTLSRSEPTWKARQAQAERVHRQRARGKQIFTPEELTALRRKERKAAKIERARLAVRAGQQLADGIVALGGELNEEDERMIARQVRHDLDAQQGQGGKEGNGVESEYGKHIPGLIYLKPKEEGKETASNGGVGGVSPNASVEKEVAKAEKQEDEEEAWDEDEYVDVEEMERLQLSPQETFFLAGMLGVLIVLDENGQELSLEHLYALLLSATLPVSRFQLAHSPFATPCLNALRDHSSAWASPNNPFLIQYVAYHHFRSLGWVVRSGAKFCVDWLLYKRGPAFGHAEFAVVVLPVFEDAMDEQTVSLTSPFGPHPLAQPRDWVWFSSVNRVNTQVLKTLILCYVIIPSLKRISVDDLQTPQAFVQGLRSHSSFRIREYSVRRFTPQRMRS